MSDIRSYFTRPGSRAGAVNFANSIDRTRQEFREECDINNLMRRFEATGVMPQPWKAPPVANWADFASVPDYLDAQNLLIQARDSFLQLPARVRARFDNDPAQLLAFVANDANREEADKLGLLKPTPPAPPVQGT